MRGNNLNDKHYELEFTRLNTVWVGTILDRIFWIGIFRVGVFQVVIISRVRIARVGTFLRGNCPSGDYPVKINRVVFIRVGVFLVPLTACNFIKEKHQRGFLVYFAKFLRTPHILQNICKRLFVKIWTTGLIYSADSPRYCIMRTMPKIVGEKH